MPYGMGRLEWINGWFTIHLNGVVTHNWEGNSNKIGVLNICILQMIHI